MSVLLGISLGPVQEFIAAARRTADLQAGSELLVEAARAAARAVADAGGELIFPARPDQDGPNRILAVLPAGEPERVAGLARAAVLDFLRQQWERYRSHLPQGAVDTARAERQILQFPEFYAAWWPLRGDYAAARRELERLLAGRKALRDFAPPSDSPDGLPKSPLDPSRDTVLRCQPNLAVPESCRGYPLWLKQRETLDGVSLLKRLRGSIGTGRTKDIPSTTRMALHAILPALETKAPASLQQLRSIAQTHGVDVGDLFYPARVEELDLDRQQVHRIVQEALRAIGRREAPVYYVILVADGDRMGQLLSEVLEKHNAPEAHREISEVLAGFQEEAQRIVRGCSGHLVYSGGDDVLALLPVNRALEAARQLAEAFARRLEPCRHTPQSGGTLSVGLAIVHALEPFQISLDRAREAEKAAKRLAKQRPAPGAARTGALAVALHTRSGGDPLCVACRWGSEQEKHWDLLLDLLRGQLARGVPYELSRLAEEFREIFPRIPEAARRLQAEANRILARKENPHRYRVPSWVDSPEALKTLVDQMVIARFLTAGEEVA